MKNELAAGAVDCPAYHKRSMSSTPIPYQLVEPTALRQFFAGIAERLEFTAPPKPFVAPDNIEQPELQQFFTNIRSRVQEAEEKQRRIDRKLATKFNVFKLIQPDENKLSDILADLLNPKGSHGQGDLFLRLLFEKLDWKPPINLNDIAVVQREALTDRIFNHRRRIDVFVDAGVLLAIENKVDSRELSDQVKDYLEHLDQCSRGQTLPTALIYLTPNGRHPESIPTATISELRLSGKLHCWSYQKEFRDWIETCREACEAERIQNFLSDFIAFIESDMKRESESDHENPSQ
jgi:PD-(D/E)XK nuclease superfamily